jgi:Tol biopolymer transport system component
MKHFNQSIYNSMILLLLIPCMITCSESPTGFVASEEARTIPWDKITGKIAYQYETVSGDKMMKTTNLIVIDGHEKKLEVIGQSDLPVAFMELCWSTDGSRITFSQFDNTRMRWQLYEIDTTNGRQAHIYAGDLHHNNPAWSNDGRLAWTEGWYGIFIDGDRFYYGGTNVSRPTWSPDSQYIVAAIHDSTSQGALYKLGLNDNTVVPLLQGRGEYNNEVFYDPIYSPDGSKIAFVKTAADEDVYGEIWLIDIDGANLVRLTSGHSDWYPAWSPNGDQIMFSRYDHLYLITIDGSDLTRVTKNRGRYPTWIQ